MAFGLEDSSIVLDGNDFDAVKQSETGLHYFAGRIGIDGILNYGEVPKGKEVKIDLEANGISTPLIIDRIVAMSGKTLNDEIIFSLYRKNERGIVRIGTQRFSNGEMPIDFPDGIVMPDMVLGVRPTRGDTTIVVYVKPVKILFTAVPNPESVASGETI